MVKLYINDPSGKNKVKYVDVNIWSLVKANILAELTLVGIVFGVAFIFGVINALLLGV